MKSLTRLMLAASLLMSSAGALALADNAKPAGTSANKVITDKATGIKTTGTVGPTGGSSTGGTVNLNSSDCKLLLGGQVIAVYDGRCGASGAYCKSPSGSACLTEK